MAPVKTKKNRVFIDSSVLIAAAISQRGAARDLLRRGFRGDFQLSVSSLVLDESERNLSVKAPEAVPDFQVFREVLVTELVDPPDFLVLEAAEVVALKDAPILAAAVQARAQYLATYDRRHILRHKDRIEACFPVSVVTPDDVLAAQGGSRR